jgi:hypothetical protein
VTSGTATLLATELLAGAGNVRTLASAGRAATVFELPGDNAVQDVGARFETEHVIREFHVAGGRTVEIEDLNLHDLALLASGGFGSGLFVGGGLEAGGIRALRRDERP